MCFMRAYRIDLLNPERILVDNMLTSALAVNFDDEEGKREDENSFFLCLCGAVLLSTKHSLYYFSKTDCSVSEHC